VRAPRAQSSGEERGAERTKAPSWRGVHAIRPAQEIYFGKTKDIVNDLRSLRSLADTKAQNDVTAELVAKLKGKAK